MAVPAGRIEFEIEQSGGTLKDIYASTPDWVFSGSSSCSGGYPVAFYGEPIQPEPEERRDNRCEYCGVKALREDRFCVGCGAPV